MRYNNTCSNIAQLLPRGGHHDIAVALTIHNLFSIH